MMFINRDSSLADNVRHGYFLIFLSFLVSDYVFIKSGNLPRSPSSYIRVTWHEKTLCACKSTIVNKGIKGNWL